MCYTQGAHVEDTALLESNRSADMGPKTGQSELRSALCFLACFWRKAQNSQANLYQSAPLGVAFLMGFPLR